MMRFVAILLPHFKTECSACSPTSAHDNDIWAICPKPSRSRHMPKKTPPDISPAGQLRWMIEHAGKTRDNLARDLGLENSTVIDAWCDGSILIPFRMIQRIDESLGGER